MKPNVAENRSFWGFLSVGFISLFGGIIMFIKFVPPVEPDGVPRDITVMFAQVFSQQNLIRNETNKYSAALLPLGVSQDECRRYLCLLRLAQDGLDYEFQLSKNGRTWVINSNSPVPKEWENRNEASPQ